MLQYSHCFVVFLERDINSLSWGDDSIRDIDLLALNVIQFSMKYDKIGVIEYKLQLSRESN